MRPSRSGAGGFTLLEVLIALAVVSIALAAAVSGAATYSGGSGYLRDKTLAHWVALNRLTEDQVIADWPATGVTSGIAEMADRQWKWTRRVEGTPDELVRRLTVLVSSADAPDAVLARVTGFVSPPLEDF